MLRYFPAERGQPVVQGPVTLILTGLRAAPTHVERMITLQYRDQSLKRTVVHLQFTSWPELYDRGVGGGIGVCGGPALCVGGAGGGFGGALGAAGLQPWQGEGAVPSGGVRGGPPPQ